jgi:hypothetical protein
MQDRKNELMPRARSEQLLIHELADEVLVYDLKRHKAHSLNETAALVWNQCNGQTTVKETARYLEEKLGTSVDERVVLFALKQLYRARLLREDEVDFAKSKARISRRELILKYGLPAAASLPLIVTLVAPTAAQGGSCLPRDASCTADSQCCSGHCRGNNLCQ